MRWKRPTSAVVMATGALVVGALFGLAGNGHATVTPALTNSTSPTITGTPQEGATLTAHAGTWSAAPDSYTYTWQRCDTNGDNCSTIGSTTPSPASTTAIYTLVAADVGTTLRVMVTATITSTSTTASATSVPTAIIKPAAPTNTGAPTISGSAAVGSTLTATNGTWSGIVTGYTYAWTRCDKTGANCTGINGATGQTYELGTTDVGDTLRVTVTASNAGGSTSKTSNQTGLVSAAPLPKNKTLPIVSGTAQIGSTLTATKGTWSGTVTGYTYTWKRCDSNGQNCSAIGAATHSTYKLTQADAGTTLRVWVTASNDAGSTAATSAPTAVVPVPTPTGCPSGTGTIQISQLKSPARLAVSGWSTTAGVVARSATAVQLHVRVTACSGRPVQGATVFAVPIPYNQFKGETGTTGSGGTVTLTEQRLKGFPANTRRQELLAVLIRASKPGTSVVGGISTRRVVSFPVAKK